MSIVRQRVVGINASNEDQIDHDALRSIPAFRPIALRSPDSPELATHPLISRLENSVTSADLLQMEDWFIDRFVESLAEVPATITLDINTFHNPAHGNQQRVLFHVLLSPVSALGAGCHICKRHEPYPQRIGP